MQERLKGKLGVNVPDDEEEAQDAGSKDDEEGNE